MGTNDSDRFGQLLFGAAVAAGAALLVAVRALARRERRFDRTVQRRLDALRAQESRSDDAEAASAADSDLPAPVERYFETVLPADPPAVQSATLRQRGEFRLNEDGDWLPMTATETVRVDPPGFLWDATIDLKPGLPVRVTDAYVDGEGTLEARLLGAVPVASAGPDGEMNESELQRYLAEAVWYPTALRPAAGVEWTPIDDRTARATVRDGAVTASLDFHFDERDRVEQVTGERYRQETERKDRWVGRFEGYERQSGVLVPTSAEVGWDGPDGTEPYWRATLTAVEYRTASTES